MVHSQKKGDWWYNSEGEKVFIPYKKGKGIHKLSAPVMKDVMTEDEAEKLYERELEEGTINTEEEGVPYYDDFIEYKNMLKDMGVKIKGED